MSSLLLSPSPVPDLRTSLRMAPKAFETACSKMFDYIKVKQPLRWSPSDPALFGHRGWSATRPENTLDAIEGALSLANVSGVEVDVWISKPLDRGDGLYESTAFLFHDATFDGRMMRSMMSPQLIQEVEGKAFHNLPIDTILQVPLELPCGDEICGPYFVPPLEEAVELAKQYEKTLWVDLKPTFFLPGTSGDLPSDPFVMAGYLVEALERQMNTLEDESFKKEKLIVSSFDYNMIGYLHGHPFGSDLFKTQDVIFGPSRHSHQTLIDLSNPPFNSLPLPEGVPNKLPAHILFQMIASSSDATEFVLRDLIAPTGVDMICADRKGYESFPDFMAVAKRDYGMKLCIYTLDGDLDATPEDWKRVQGLDHKMSILTGGDSSSGIDVFISDLPSEQIALTNKRRPRENLKKTIDGGKAASILSNPIRSLDVVGSAISELADLQAGVVDLIDMAGPALLDAGKMLLSGR